VDDLYAVRRRSGKDDCTIMNMDWGAKRQPCPDQQERCHLRAPERKAGLRDREKQRKVAVLRA
jgi:hypothetical protein